MRILFVWPNKDQFGFKPLGISLLSALARLHGHETVLFDTTGIDFGFVDNTEARTRLKIFKDVDLEPYGLGKRKVHLANELLRVLEAFRPDVAAFSVLTDEFHIAVEASRIVKQWNRDTVVLWGNKAPTLAPERTLATGVVDYVCRGEGMVFFPRFLLRLERGRSPRDLDNLAWLDETGRVVQNPLAGYFQDLDSLPHLDWSLFDERHFVKPFDGKIYRGADHMIYWGCPGVCSYCINRSYRSLYGGGAGKFLRAYSVGRMMEELVALTNRWDIGFYKFHDEDFCLKPMDYFRELAQAYAAEVGVPFTAMANARNITPEKVDLLRTMGCVSVTIGIETGNDRLRREVLRRIETREHIIRATRLLDEAGIRTSSFNMLAIPGETRQTFFETVELNRAAGVRYPNAGFFFPLEGTELHDVSVQQGFFDPGLGLVFRNDAPALCLPGISREELVRLRERFTLYIKFPKELWPHIRRSENDDDTGRGLTKRLYEIYAECVFANDGVWDDGGRLPEYKEQLQRIIEEGHDEADRLS